MYGSASVAEEVCHLNRWDQCSLPLNALETALELRQLDTVSFFLRNRGSCLLTKCLLSYNEYPYLLDSQSENKNGEAPPTSRPPPPLPPDQLDAAVDLLTNSIRLIPSEHTCTCTIILNGSSLYHYFNNFIMML